MARSSPDFDFENFISSLQRRNEPEKVAKPSTESVNVMDELLRELSTPDVVMCEGKLQYQPI